MLNTLITTLKTRIDANQLQVSALLKQNKFYGAIMPALQLTQKHLDTLVVAINKDIKKLGFDNIQPPSVSASSLEGTYRVDLTINALDTTNTKEVKSAMELAKGQDRRSKKSKNQDPKLTKLQNKYLAQLVDAGKGYIAFEDVEGVNFEVTISYHSLLSIQVSVLHHVKM